CFVSRFEKGDIVLVESREHGKCCAVQERNDPKHQLLSFIMEQEAIRSTYAEAFRGPLYLLTVSLPSNTRMAGYEMISCSRQRSASAVQSTLKRSILVCTVAASHSASSALLGSL